MNEEQKVNLLKEIMIRLEKIERRLFLLEVNGKPYGDKSTAPCNTCSQPMGIVTPWTCPECGTFYDSPVEF